MSELMTVNRSMIAVYFTENFYKVLEGVIEPGITLEDLNEDPLLFLVPAFDEDNDDSADEVIEAHQEAILAAALELFFDEDDIIPKTNDPFDTYFEVEPFENVYDLASDYELGYEEDADEDDELYEDADEAPTFQKRPHL